jgi:hypothetical protein
MKTRPKVGDLVRRLDAIEDALAMLGSSLRTELEALREELKALDSSETPTKPAPPDGAAAAPTRIPAGTTTRRISEEVSVVVQGKDPRVEK